MMNWYVLAEDGETPILATSATWTAWADKKRDYQIREAVSPTCDVSTVFLGLDHSFDGGPPVLWETMIFGGPLGETQWRYTSAADAREGHRKAVAMARDAEIAGFANAEAS